MKTSERTCCICRGKAEKKSLLRVVAVDGKVVVDGRQGMPGRGAYVHPSAECISRMNQPGRWERALRLNGGALRPGLMAETVGELLQRFAREANPDEEALSRSSGGSRPTGSTTTKKFRL